MHNRKVMCMFHVPTAVMDFDEILCYKKINFVAQWSIGATTLQNAETVCWSNFLHTHTHNNNNNNNKLDI